MSIIDTLITTHADGEGYGLADLNRVGQALSYIQGRLYAAGYSVTVTAKRDWVISDIPTTAQLDALISDITAIRSVLAVRSTTPVTPADMDDLTANEANDIEKILKEVDGLITNMTFSYKHSGTFNAGQGGLIL